MTAVPLLPPVTAPLLTVAIVSLADDHAPPTVASASDVTPCSHTVNVPVIAAGFALTVNVAVERHEPIV